MSDTPALLATTTGAALDVTESADHFYVADATGPIRSIKKSLLPATVTLARMQAMARDGWDAFNRAGWIDPLITGNATATLLTGAGAYTTSAEAAEANVADVLLVASDVDDVADLMSGDPPAPTVAQAEQVRLDAIAALAAMNTTARRLGALAYGAAGYATIALAEAGLGALTDLDVAPGQLGAVGAAWIVVAGVEGHVTIDASGYLVMSAAPGETLTVYAVLDTIAASCREWHTSFQVDVSGAWTEQHSSAFAALMDDAASPFVSTDGTLGPVLLHKDVGTITTKAGPPAGLISGGGFVKTAEARPNYQYCVVQNGASPGSFQTTAYQGDAAPAPPYTPPNLEFIGTDWRKIRDGGSGDRFTQNAYMGQGITADGAIGQFSPLRQSGTSILTLAKTRLRAAFQVINNGGVSNVVYTVRRIIHKHGLSA